MAETALVLLAIGERMRAYRQLTEPFWKEIAHQLSAELVVITERFEPGRKLAAWQKLLLPQQLGPHYRQIIYADVDILPHPDVPLQDLLEVPEGKVGLCATSPSRRDRPQDYYAEALQLPKSEVSNVQQIINTGLIVWKTAGSEPIQSLFRHLYDHAKQHCAEQSALSCAVQQEGRLHLLPRIYNTNFIRTKPFPFNTFALNKRLQQFPPLMPLARWSHRRALLRLIAQPCFIHFVGGIFIEALKDGANLLQQQLDDRNVQVLPAPELLDSMEPKKI